MSVRLQRLGIQSITIVSAAAAVVLMPTAIRAADPPKVDPDGSIHVPAFQLPESSLLDDKSRAVLKYGREFISDLGSAFKSCPTSKGADRAARDELRKCHVEAFYKTASYKRMRNRYGIIMTAQQIGGVNTEVFTPTEGVAPANKNRVLLNLHGGSFLGGWQIFSHAESIPIASVGKVKIISVDYRHAPDYAFPAASEDVAAVYRELIKTYKPRNIGIYGCSAGGLLTAQSVAWLQKEKLPRPAAVAMLGGGASYYQDGDSGIYASVREGFPMQMPDVHPYFKVTDAANPLAFPIKSAAMMSKFPPSLLIASTRDVGLSAVVYTHSRLIKLGVEADLHVWEGMNHCFQWIPDLPESREAYDVMVKFFDRHLGK